jgi:hypothetical protein
VGDGVGDGVGEGVGDSVGDAVGDAVGARVGLLVLMYSCTTSVTWVLVSEAKAGSSILSRTDSMILVGTLKKTNTTRDSVEAP